MRPRPTPLSVFYRLALVFAGFLFLDLLFWSTVDFGQFVPPSPGSWQERAYLAGVTARGPIVMTWIEALGSSGWVACALIVATVAAAMRWPHLRFLQFLAYFAILVWWFLGFCGAAIRIT